MTRRTRSSLAIVAAAISACSLLSIAALEGCTIVNGLVADRPDTGVGKNPDAGTDADADAGPIANGCAVLPGRPAVPDDGSLEIVAVAKKMYLTPQVGAAPVGYDLDESCLLPSSDTCKSPKPVADDPGGLDNRGAQLFALVNDRTDLEDRANEGIIAGKNGFLFKVAKYNGKSDDYQVEVSIYSALGLLDGGTNVKPDFKETEKWTIDEGQFNEFGLPKLLVDGWVVGGTVYAVIGQDAALRLSNTFSVQLSGGVLRLDLDLTGAKPAIRGGVVAGRWTARDMIATVSRQRLSDASASAICAPGQELILLAAKGQICDNVDIMGDRKVDKTGANCDATSVAFAFEAGPAALGPKMAFTPEDDCPGFDAGACEK